MTEPIKSDPLFRVEAKSPEFEPQAKVLEAILNTSKAQDFVNNHICDLFGVPRPGRQPDYLMGRWCIGCHNSLPEDWRGPCDVCGKVNEVAWDGLLADSPETASEPLYRGIPRP